MNGFSDPEKNVAELDLAPGMRVADFGAGTGLYTFAAAKRVTDIGKVYCIDVQQSLLKRVDDEARKRSLYNVEFIWTDLEKLGGSKLADNKVDSVIISNILFQVEEKEVLLKEAARILRPGGKLLIIDWSDSFGGLGPSASSVLSKTSGRELLEHTGFSIKREVAAGEHHWGFIAVKK